ncbi:MAG: rhodanese-like domain-containing protein, partial [Acidobacteriota bacterium]
VDRSVHPIVALRVLGLPAGSVTGVASLRRALAADDRLAGMDFRQSWSAATPFRRLKVKLKNEIIAFGVPGVDPAHDPAPALEPTTLKSWLDEGRELILLDTRNAFELAHGSFAGAVHLGNDTFRGFAAVAGTLRVNNSETPVVTFCTGGIRCEKAAPLLRQLGHRKVFQLSGGILRYLERVGSAHYRGTCFVFDERVGLDSDLAPQRAEQL